MINSFRKKNNKLRKYMCSNVLVFTQKTKLNFEITPIVWNIDITYFNNLEWNKDKLTILRSFIIFWSINFVYELFNPSLRIELIFFWNTNSIIDLFVSVNKRDHLPKNIIEFVDELNVLQINFSSFHCHTSFR
jgi:hypothetical protein